MNFEETNNTIWDIPCDIFIPGAASKIVSMQQMERLISNGLQVISCGANVPLSMIKYFWRNCTVVG